MEERNSHRRVYPEMRCVMITAVDRVMKAFATKHKAMTPEQERKVRDEVSEFVAELLARRADQLEKFSRIEPRV